MRIFGVQLRFPTQVELVAVPLAVAGGAYLGSLIQKTTQGSTTPVAAMAFTAGMVTFMGLSGANFDAGWRGVALTSVAALLTFVVTLFVYPLL